MAENSGKQSWASKRWLITGTSSGFGRAMVEAVAEAGGHVFAAARNLEGIRDLAERFGNSVVPVQLDVTDPASIAAALDSVTASGGIDVLVNNAGYGFAGGIEESAIDEIRAVMETNFFGAAALTRAFLPMLRARGESFVVNISSIAALVSVPTTAWYSASKAALESMSEALAAEGAEFGIRTMIVEPAAFATDFAVRSRKQARNKLDIYKSVTAGHDFQDNRAWDGAPQPPAGIRAMISAMDSAEPPLRLLLGPRAPGFAEAMYKRRIDEVERWREISSFSS